MYNSNKGHELITHCDENKTNVIKNEGNFSVKRRYGMLKKRDIIYI